MEISVKRRFSILTPGSRASWSFSTGSSEIMKLLTSLGKTTSSVLNSSLIYRIDVAVSTRMARRKARAYPGFTGWMKIRK
jgi:hypothetical protein